jgi:hypothetical protein
MMQISARVKSVNPSKDLSRVYVDFVSLDVGQWSQSFRSEDWNGFKEKDDVVLNLAPDVQQGTRQLDGGRHMATSDLVLRIESMTHAKGS